MFGRVACRFPGFREARPGDGLGMVAVACTLMSDPPILGETSGWTS